MKNYLKFSLLAFILCNSNTAYSTKCIQPGSNIRQSTRLTFIKEVPLNRVNEGHEFRGSINECTISIAEINSIYNQIPLTTNSPFTIERVGASRGSSAPTLEENGSITSPKTTSSYINITLENGYIISCPNNLDSLKDEIVITKYPPFCKSIEDSREIRIRNENISNQEATIAL